MHQYITLEDTVYLGFASNLTSGAAGDGTTPLFDVRLGGAVSTAAPILSGTPTLLTNAAYSDGCYEVAIAATAANGFAANSTYLVFVTLTIDSVTPAAMIGSFRTAPVPANATQWNSLTTVALPLVPTVAGRSLDVTATGAAGIDWANVENPTTALNLSATNIDVDQVVASVSGAVGSVTGAVGSVTGAVGSVTGNVGGNVVGTVASVVGAVGSVTGNVGGNVVGTVASVTGNVGGNVVGSVGSVVGAVGSVTAGVTVATNNDKTGYTLVSGPLDAAATRAAIGLASANLDTQLGTLLTSAAYTAPDNASITAIKAKTDSLTFTLAGKLDVNLLVVNGVTVTGTGTDVDPWGPV